jgi:uncharacterized protein
MTIALGVNWSPLHLECPEIAALVDYVELPAWLLPQFEQLPHDNIILHNLDKDWSLADANALDAGWGKRLGTALERTQSPWFSVHLGFASEVVRFDGHMLPVSSPLERNPLLERITSNLKLARDRCPVPLLVENLDYCPEGAYEHVCEPGFIREVVEEVDCGFLLDIGHLQVTSSWIGVEPLDILSELPLDRVREIHVTSPRRIAGDGWQRMDDSHHHLLSRDYDLLGAVLDRCEPAAVTLEYTRDVDKLCAQLTELRAFLCG